MAINGVNNSQAIRLMGLSSGMDTDSIIKQTLKLHQMKIDAQMRSRVKVEWKQQALNSIKDDVTNFRWSFLTALGTNAMRSSSIYNATIANVTGKNASAVSITTSTSTPLGSLKIGQIESLAKATSVSSMNGVSRDGNGFNLSDKIGSMLMSTREIKFDSKGDANVNFNGTNIVLNQNDSIDDINAKIAAKNGNRIVFSPSQVDSMGKQYARATVNGKEVFLYKDDAYKKLEDSVLTYNNITRAMIYGTNTSKTVNINGMNIAVDEAESFNDLLDKINYESSLISGPVYDWVDDGNGNFSVDLNINGKNVTVSKDMENWGCSHISDVADAMLFGTGSSASVEINGASITINKSDTITDLNKKIQQAGGQSIVFDQSFQYAGTTVKYTYVNFNGRPEQVAQSQLLVSNFTSGAVEKANANKLSGFNFDVNGKAYFTLGNGKVQGTFEVNKDMSIGDVMDSVNKSGLGITMRYDKLSDSFTLESNTAGPSVINVGGLSALGIYNGDYSNGTLARVQINGEWVESKSNTIDYRGLKITLNSTTAAGDEETSVVLKRDATEPLNKIKAFIEAYNTMIKKLEGMLKETKTRAEASYTPLTDEEKSQMSEKQIEEWETIAKKGLLRNDAGIQALTSSLRGALFDAVTAAGLSPSQIGLTTGRWDQNTGGQIMLDEDKLRAALEADPDKVANIFMGGSDSKNYADRGLTWRMEDLLLGYVNGSQSSSLGSLENSIKRANEQMEKLTKKMYDEEDRLYKKFAAMETALAKIQSQSDWLSSMLNSNNSK